MRSAQKIRGCTPSTRSSLASQQVDQHRCRWTCQLRPMLTKSRAFALPPHPTRHMYVYLCVQLAFLAGNTRAQQAATVVEWTSLVVATMTGFNSRVRHIIDSHLRGPACVAAQLYYKQAHNCIALMLADSVLETLYDRDSSTANRQQAWHSDTCSSSSQSRMSL
eukprot:COSAG01_NODE_19763_length_990_cov_6.557392_2_plen_163_part_01